MTPISDLIAAIVERAKRDLFHAGNGENARSSRRSAPYPAIPAPIADDPADERIATAWREPGE